MGSSVFGRWGFSLLQSFMIYGNVRTLLTNPQPDRVHQHFSREPRGVDISRSGPIIPFVGQPSFHSTVQEDRVSPPRLVVSKTTFGRS